MVPRIDRVILREIHLQLREPFETSFGRTQKRRIVLVEVQGEGVSGWGEVTAGEAPLFNEEWTDSAWMLLREFLAPAFIRAKLEHPEKVFQHTAKIRGHHMTRGALEAAVWDLTARAHQMPLWKMIGGGARMEIPSGVSIGLQESIERLLEKIEQEISRGYQRIKVKIKPGCDVQLIEKIRKRFPHIKLMADANAAYSLADTDRLKQLDQFNLMMIEQPLAYDDLLDHARLARQLQTPICLDESIRHERHAEQAISQGACQVINIKLGRVGGFGAARRVHDIAMQHRVPVWCGGMLESGIGRAHNIALATLPNFVLPGDVSASERYWEEDIIDPPVTVTPRGTIPVSQKPGLGYDLKLDLIEKLTVRKEVIS